jgi:hypothetical protein
LFFGIGPLPVLIYGSAHNNAVPRRGTNWRSVPATKEVNKGRGIVAGASAEKGYDGAMGRAVGIAVLVLAVAAAVFGLGAGGDFVLGWLVGVEAWLFGAAVYPSLLLLLIGFGVGFFGVPALLEWARRRKTAEAFRQGRDAVQGREGKTLARLAGAAYYKWWTENTELPDEPELPTSLDALIAHGKPARWSKLASGDMADVEAEMFFANPILWEFVTTLAAEIDATPGETGEPALLEPRQRARFHEARLALSAFWNGAGERVFATRTLARVAAQPAPDEPGFRLLAFTEAAAAKARGAPMIALHLLRLGAEPRFWEAPFRAPAAADTPGEPDRTRIAPSLGDPQDAPAPATEERLAQAE